MQQLFSRSLYNRLDNISITRGKFNELNLSRVSAFASRAANTVALFFRGWRALCLAEGSGFGSSRPGPSVGTTEVSLPPWQLDNSALETQMSQRQYVADQQRRERVHQGAGRHGSVAFVFCPQQGEEKESGKHLPDCPLPVCSCASPAGEVERQGKRLKIIKLMCLKASRKSYLPTNYVVSSAPRTFLKVHVVKVKIEMFKVCPDKEGRQKNQRQRAQIPAFGLTLTGRG